MHIYSDTNLTTTECFLNCAAKKLHKSFMKMFNSEDDTGVKSLVHPLDGSIQNSQGKVSRRKGNSEKQEILRKNKFIYCPKCLQDIHAHGDVNTPTLPFSLSQAKPLYKIDSQSPHQEVRVS